MDKKKQIEEMANAYYEAMLKARGTLGSMNEGAPKWYAKELYNAGYRKASEVAREIFEEIETSLSIADFKGGEVYYAIRAEDYLHYKKKYAEDEKDNAKV